MKTPLLLLFLGCLALGLSGCATRSALVIARCPKPLPAAAKKIAILPSPQPQPSEEFLVKCVATGLKQAGLEIVPQPQADFMLSCAFEDDWQTYQRPTTPTVAPYMQSSTGPILVPPGTLLFKGSRWSGESPITSTYTEEQVAIKGIRLRIFWNRGLQTGHFETAWEGYIETGRQSDEEREPILIRTLLRYFGRNYSGKAKLDE